MGVFPGLNNREKLSKHAITGRKKERIKQRFFGLRINAIPRTSVPRGGTTLPKFTKKRLTNDKRVTKMTDTGRHNARNIIPVSSQHNNYDSCVITTPEL